MEKKESGEGTAIWTEGLTKRYGGRNVVDELSVEVPRGVIAGFVGPNGAGKTTTLRMLLGLVRRTSGAGTVLGRPLDDLASYLPRVGGLIEGPAFYPALSGRRNLEVLAALAGQDHAQITALLHHVGLQSRAGDAYRTYSTGMKQRLGIAAALLGDPELLVLDEPTNGLDPAGIHEMRELVGRLARKDRTILVSSHLLVEVEQVCDWLIMIDQGRLVFQGPTAELLSSAAISLVCVPHNLGDLERLQRVLVSSGYSASIDERRLMVAVDGVGPTEMAADINRRAMDEGIVLIELRPISAGLEDRYLSMVGGHDV